HPSDLPLARLTWMVQAPLGLHPSAFACFVTRHLLGSGTDLDTGRSMTPSHAHSSWCHLASRTPSRTGQATFRHPALQSQATSELPASCFKASTRLEEPARGVAGRRSAGEHGDGGSERCSKSSPRASPKRSGPRRRRRPCNASPLVACASEGQSPER